MKRYTPSEMVQIAQPFQLSVGVLAEIEAIYRVVSAEDYSSSPVFPVKETKKKKAKATLADFTANLNKLSDETYDVVSPLIFATLEQLDDPARKAAATYLVQTACNSTFGSEWYAKVFAQAAKRWDVFYQMFVDRQEDYKEALLIGEENQRTFLLFAIHLNKYGAIGTLQALAEKIQNMVEACVAKESMKLAVEEWAEQLMILMQHGYNVDAVRLKNISTMRPSTHPGVSNKTVFKYMDMIELK
jgi:hypothetical protein